MSKSSGSAPRKSRICFFGGEKGGIGKTTLATIFAYLFYEAGQEIAGLTLDHSNPAFKKQLAGILPDSSVGVFSCARGRDMIKLGNFLSQNSSKIVLIDSPSSFYLYFEQHLLDLIYAVDRLDFFWIVSEEQNSSKQLFAYSQILDRHPNANYWVFFPNWLHGEEDFNSGFSEFPGLSLHRFPALAAFVLDKLKGDLKLLEFQKLGDPYLKGMISSYLIRFKNELGKDLDTIIIG